MNMQTAKVDQRETPSTIGKRKESVDLSLHELVLFICAKEALEKEKSRRKGGRDMVEAKQRYENKWLDFPY